MPSEDLFIDTETLFGQVAAMRDRFVAAGDAEVCPATSLTSTVANEALGLLSGLASGVLTSMTAQFEIAARLISIGAFDAIQADGED